MGPKVVHTRAPLPPPPTTNYALFYDQFLDALRFSTILFPMFQATDLATAPVTSGAPTAVVSAWPTCATPSVTASPTALTKSIANISTR